MLTATDRIITLWEIDKGRILITFDSRSKAVSIALRRGASEFASNEGKNCVLWNWKTGEKLREFNAPDGQVNAVLFSGDGKLLYSAASDRTMGIWDVESASKIRSVRARLSYGIAASPDGKLFARACSDNAIRIRKEICAWLRGLPTARQSQLLPRTAYPGEDLVIFQLGTNGDDRSGRFSINEISRVPDGYQITGMRFAKENTISNSLRT